MDIFDTHLVTNASFTVTMKISLTPFALNSSYFSMYAGACELQEGVNAPGTPSSGAGQWRRHQKDAHIITHKDGLASRRERERFGGVIFLDWFFERELISWLGRMLSEECRRLCVGGLGCT